MQPVARTAKSLRKASPLPFQARRRDFIIAFIKGTGLELRF
jgi:hypothetical protein